MRSILIAFLLLISTAAAFAGDAAAPATSAEPPGTASLSGVVADPTGAIIPGAEIDLLDATGTTLGKFQSRGDGSFLVTAPHPGSYTLVVSEAGFGTVKQPVTIGAPQTSLGTSSAPPALRPTLKIVLHVASTATNVEVNADSSQDLTATDANRDSSVITAKDLKSLPIFDNDYVSAMGSFLDSDVASTGGSGLIVDGVEANRATVSSSAVQEVRINQDPYSARYYYPGRGQMEVITKAAADHYHGELNFHFRDSNMNAQNALAPSKPFEQRRIYEGHATGPLPHTKKGSFLASFNRAEEDLDSVVSATIEPTAANPTGAFHANVPAPTRDTEFSVRAARQFGESSSGYVQYSYQDWNGKNQGVGGQTLAAAAYNPQYREDDLVAHADLTLSATTLNQASLVAEHTSSRNANVTEAPQIVVSGNYVSGSAQNDSFRTEYNARLTDIVTQTRGRHMVQYGISIPHIGRRAFDDHTNELGSYTFAPTLAADGVTVLATAFQNQAANLPSEFSANTGDTHFIYHQQEMGAFVQDQFKANARFSITPGLRYDWQNFLATRRLGFSPRFSFAWVLDEKSKTIVRGGGGIYYDRFGSGPLLDLERYENARRRSVTFSLNPLAEPASGCVPITLCVTLLTQAPNTVQLAPHAKIPYQIQYGLSIERQLGEHATGTASVYSMRGIDRFRSVDINAPTPLSGYTLRPNPAFGRIRQMQAAGFMVGNGMDLSYRGRFNKYFTGFGRYTWSHYESNNGGIGWFPQDQLEPNEWSNSGFDRRHRLGLYGMFQPDKVLNLSAGIFANSGQPWTVYTGADPYGDGFFNARPQGVRRNSENYPPYVDLDLRWGHDFAITPNKKVEAPKLGFSAGAFNVLNHVNDNGINQIESSTTFEKVTSVAPPRRIQLAMRFQF